MSTLCFTLFDLKNEPRVMSTPHTVRFASLPHDEFKIHIIGIREQRMRHRNLIKLVCDKTLEENILHAKNVTDNATDNAATATTNTPLSEEYHNPFFQGTLTGTLSAERVILSQYFQMGGSIEYTDTDAEIELHVAIKVWKNIHRVRSIGDETYSGSSKCVYRRAFHQAFKEYIWNICGEEYTHQLNEANYFEYMCNF
jgi:hypothetical protein